MKYILMHKEIPVAQIDLDEVICGISHIDEVFRGEHLPVGVHIANGIVNREELNSWWRKRSIPASRDGLRTALDNLNIQSSEALLHKCYGLSLSDQYWVCPEGSNLVWGKVNFFDNAFSEDVGNILLGHASSSGSISLVAPDNTSDGWLKKKWSVAGDKRCLLKAGSGVFRQEPYNEVIASAIMRRLEIPHTDYTIAVRKGEPYSICNNFITKDTELITAHHIMKSQKKPNHKNDYQHFVDCCSGIGLDAKAFLDQMLTVDFLLVNEDRHTNNFGLIRNAESLQYVGFAPIYDNGTSLWYNTPTQKIYPRASELESKPFKSTHSEQIKLVTSFDWLDTSALRGVDEEYSEILKGSEFIDDTRRGRLCGALKERVDLLTELVERQRPRTVVIEKTSHGKTQTMDDYAAKIAAMREAKRAENRPMPREKEKEPEDR